MSNHRYDWLQADPVLDTFLGYYSPIRSDYLIDDYLSDTQPVNVVKSVREFDPSNPAGETKWLQAIADAEGFPHGIVGFANLAAPDIDRRLDEHLQYPTSGESGRTSIGTNDIPGGPSPTAAII